VQILLQLLSVWEIYYLNIKLHKTYVIGLFSPTQIVYAKVLVYMFRQKELLKKKDVIFTGQSLVNCG